MKPMQRRARKISCRRCLWWDDGQGKDSGLISACLLDGACFCQSEIQWLVICCRIKNYACPFQCSDTKIVTFSSQDEDRVRSDFVGSARKLMRGRFVELL